MTLVNQHDLPFQLLIHQNNNRIIFQDVYYNGYHSLKQLQIINLTNASLTVQLDSTLHDQLGFQLENENIKDLILQGNMATNTAAAAAAAATTNSAAAFNQLFNYVNHTDHIDLAPNEKRSLVLAFLPLLLPENSFNNTTVQSITGNVFFKSNDYLLNVEFEATVCQSILVVANELDTSLIFEDSLVGETYIKDITIRNLSAIELYWKLNTLDLMHINNRPSSSSSSSSSSGGSSTSFSTTTPTVDDWLQFVDASTFITLDHDNLPPIPAFAKFTFRVIFTPKETGKFNYDLQIENCNDISNIIQTKIHATIRSCMHRDTLVVTSGNIVDFGDCVSGTWNTQQIVLNNISEESIEIHFVAQDDAELGFDIMAKPEEETSSNNVVVLSSPLSSASSIKSHDSTVVASSGGGGHPASPTTSYKTIESSEEYSSGHSYASTGTLSDVDHIDMLTAFNQIYSATHGSMVTTSEQQFNTRIEYMVLKPGAERVIQVSYRPPKDDATSVYAGHFIRQNFNVLLEYRPNKSANKPMEHKLIQCKATTCTSFVQVIPQVIDFGDTDVGTQKSFPVKIINRSEIYAHVEIVFESKVLNCTSSEILLQPKSSVEIKLDMYPRKVNAAYKRQITLVNYLNRDNDQIIEVSSNNIDKHRVTFHSLFYGILTPTGANFLDFGPIALNSPAIRTCTIVNIRDAPLLLGVATSSQQEIVIYTKKKPTKSSPSTSSFADVSLEPKDVNNPPVTETFLTGNKRRTITRMTNGQYSSTAYLDLATVPQHIKSSLSIKQKQQRHMARVNSSKPYSSLFLPRQQQELIDKRQQPINTTTNTNQNIVTTTTTTTTTTSQQKQKQRFKKKTTTATFVGITGTSQQQQQQQLTKKVYKNIDWPDIAGKARVPLDDLISILEHGSLSRTPQFFTKQGLEEEEFVRYQLAWRTELHQLIEKGELVPTSLLQLGPRQEEEIMIVYTPTMTFQSPPPLPHHSFTSKNTASISFRLIDYDASDEEEEEFIPVLRKVIIRAQVCKSSMWLGQRNINFGLVDRGERHSKTIVLHNKSETPLLYTIKRSGSIASGDIHFGMGRHGVIRAFGKREIEFTFEPSLAGSFMEQLEVMNIRDQQDKKTILLKAMVRRLEYFTIKSSRPEFIFPGGGEGGGEIVMVTNTSRQSKMFEIRVTVEDTDQLLLPLLHFSIVTDTTTITTTTNTNHSLSIEQEEEIESLEQKLKIAIRKDQPDKIQKYIKRLAKLKKVAAAAATTTEEDEEEEGGNKMLKQQQIKNGLIFSLEPNTSKNIFVGFNNPSSSITTNVVKQKDSHDDNAVTITGRILIHEHRNIDHVKAIPFSCKISVND